MMKRFWVFFLMIVVISCSTAEKRNKVMPDSSPVTIPVRLDRAGTLVFSELFDQPEFIALETNRTSLFSRAEQLIISDSLIFVVPDQPDNTIIIFHLDGRHRNTIYNVGRGPEEYISLASAFISESEHLIYSFDPGNNRYICMDYDGRIVRSFKASGIYGWGMVFNPLNDKLVIDLSFGGIDLLEKGEVLTPYLLAEVDTASFEAKPQLLSSRRLDNMNLYGFNIYRDTLLYLPYIWDTVYQILHSETLPRFIFDFGPHTKPPDLVNAQDNGSFYKILKTGKFVCYHHNFMENDDFVFTTHRTTTREMVVNRFNKKNLTSDSYTKFFNEYIGKVSEEIIGFRDFPVGMVNNKMVYIHDPVDILKGMKTNNFKDIKETDNPIIGLYPIRKLR